MINNRFNVFYLLLCSRADLLTDSVDLEYERKTKRILGRIF